MADQISAVRARHLSCQNVCSRHITDITVARSDRNRLRPLQHILPTIASDKLDEPGTGRRRCLRQTSGSQLKIDTGFRVIPASRSGSNIECNGKADHREVPGFWGPKLTLIIWTDVASVRELSTGPTTNTGWIVTR